jgi:hypothetical protein
MIAEKAIINKIFVIRGRKVMIDSDLAELCEVETKVLKRAVRRNILRFPADFMFEVSDEELLNLRWQFRHSSWDGVIVMPPNGLFYKQGDSLLYLVPGNMVLHHPGQVFASGADGLPSR